MKFVLLLLCLLTGSLVYTQEKYALLVSPAESKELVQLQNARKDLQVLTHALTVQGFKTGNIITDTSTDNKNSFLAVFNTMASRLRRGDFMLLYLDVPLGLTPDKTNAKLIWGNDPVQDLPITELATAMENISGPLNDAGVFFSLFNSEITGFSGSGLYADGVAPLNGLLACRPGEKENYTGNGSLFIQTLASVLTSGSSYITTYGDLRQKAEQNMLLYTSRQHPVLLMNNKKIALFNNRFIKAPVYFTVRSQPDDQTIVINAGQNLTILPGTKVNFYPADTYDTAKKIQARGIVISSSEITATVRLSDKKPASGLPFWAYAGWNDTETSRLTPLKFNSGFLQAGDPAKNKYFEAIVKEIKDNPRLGNYIKFVPGGGDLQISDIGLLSKDSISCTIINPRTGGLVKDFFYSLRGSRLTYNNDGFDKYSELEDYLVHTAEWQYLASLYNPVAELQVHAELKNKNNEPVQKQNGYPVVYENDEMILSLHNPGDKKIYFSVIGLRADKSIKLIYPGLGESGSTYFIPPGETFTTESFTIPPVFGQEKLKIITHTKPVEPGELREKNILTRKKQEEGFLPEYVNIQEFEYEIRSSVYAANNKKTIVRTTVTGKKIQISNPSLEKIFFNVLQSMEDGSYKTVLPQSSAAAQSCVVNAGNTSAFELPEVIPENTQLIYVVADRPFLLSRFTTEEKTINELLTDIIRNGRIPGTPVNKITLTQQLVSATGKTATRGNEILIKIVSPRIAAERNTPLQVTVVEFSINGFALTEENRPVQSVKINGEPVEYDRDLKFFDKIIRLAPGKNKIVVEATDDKGFTTARTFEVELMSANGADASTPGINYFLGIGVDSYTTWPRLFNAKNDIIGFARLMEQKFGYLPANSLLLLDTAATRRNIIRQIRTFLVKVKPNDNVIIYFSGHGNRDQLTDGDYYFIPSDGEAEDISSAVKSTDIIDNFKNIKAKNCLLIMDACFSGLISNSVNKQISIANANKNPEDLPSKWIITSGRATKVSDGIPGSNSPFAAVLLNYLRETTEPSKLTISKLIDHLKDNVPKFNKQQLPFGMSIAGEGELTFRIIK